MTKFANVLILAVAIINICLVNSFLVNRIQIQTQRGQVGRLFAGKKAEKEEIVEEPPARKGPGGKDVIRGILWATTPWIFNSYEVSACDIVGHI